MSSASREELCLLMTKKDEIEAEIKELLLVLDSVSIFGTFLR